MNSKEHPILFTGAMVRALLNGSKTQTRRIMKPQPNFDTARNVIGHHILDESAGYDWFGGVGLKDDGAWGYVQPNIKCPYGQPGDKLWVRETWAGPLVSSDQWEESNDVTEFETSNFCEYAADGGPKPEYLDQEENLIKRWVPSIHMPRWASRITLEITGVRVERLQDISEGDAMAEGVSVHPDHCGKPSTNIYSPVQAYRYLWESINNHGSWDSNPWVWVVEFKKTTP